MGDFAFLIKHISPMYIAPVTHDMVVYQPRNGKVRRLLTTLGMLGKRRSVSLCPDIRHMGFLQKTLMRCRIPVQKGAAGVLSKSSESDASFVAIKADLGKTDVHTCHTSLAPMMLDSA